MQFNPKPAEPADKHFVQLTFNDQEYARLRDAAAKSGLSIKALSKQAVTFALDNMGKKSNG